MEKTSFLKEPVGGQSVVNKIVDNITNAIINGELNPGDKIPTEAELSESMGAGRNSVREAIKVLEAYGVVHIKRAEGTFVSQEYDSRMIYPVLYGIILQKDSTSQIVELRKVIDVGLLQLAVDKLRSKSLEQTQMEAIEKAMEELEYQAHMDKPQARSLYEADVQFHMAIVGITENVMLQSICNYVENPPPFPYGDHRPDIPGRGSGKLPGPAPQNREASAGQGFGRHLCDCRGTLPVLGKSKR